MVSLSEEQWRAIPGQEGKYEASNLGRIRSVDRIIEKRNRWGQANIPWKGRVLKPTVHHTGYLVVKFGGDKNLTTIHQAVARTWIGPQGDLVVNHINGIKTDNRVVNLEYITSKDNVHHAYRTGLISNKGETNGKAQLTDALVRMIRALPEHVTSASVARQLGVEDYVVQRARCGLSWKHVTS